MANPVAGIVNSQADDDVVITRGREVGVYPVEVLEVQKAERKRKLLS